MPAARIQPQGRTRVNKAHPLARNLVFAYNGANDQAALGALYSRGSTWGATQSTPQGVGRKTAGDQTGNIQFALPITSTREVTVIYFAKEATSATGWTDPISIGDGSNDICVELYGNGSNGLCSFISGYPSTNGGFGTSTSVLDGKIHATALRLSVADGTMSLYADGKSAGSNAYSTDATFNRVALANRTAVSSSRAYKNDGYLAAFVFNRALSPAEIAQVSANPWQLFDGQPAILSAASAPTGTGATATPPGVSASSAVGSILASGQARATSAGVSAAASVGSATASGAASKAVVGVSASAAVGAVTAAGTTVVNGTAAPVGVSASAAVGSPSASGATVINGNASAAGVAASSAVGATVARGSASAAANGVQAVAAVGTASANGGVSVAGNAQPAGVSAVASVGTPSASGATVTHGNASATGVAASASVGAVAVSASASAQPAGVSVLATIGQPVASGQIQMHGNALPAGVIAYAYIGSATAGSQTFASAPAGPGYSRAFSNTTRPTQRDTRRP